MEDNSVDIDWNLPPQSNLDLITNGHDHKFIEFLKDNRAIICNGRITPEYNDYTFLSPQGNSVPDYLYTNIDHLHYCKTVEVCRVSDLINMFNLLPPPVIPDHSLIIAQFDVSCHNFSQFNSKQPDHFPDINNKFP